MFRFNIIKKERDLFRCFLNLSFNCLSNQQVSVQLCMVCCLIIWSVYGVGSAPHVRRARRHNIVAGGGASRQSMQIKRISSWHFHRSLSLSSELVRLFINFLLIRRGRGTSASMLAFLITHDYFGGPGLGERPA